MQLVSLAGAHVSLSNNPKNYHHSEITILMNGFISAMSFWLWHKDMGKVLATKRRTGGGGEFQREGGQKPEIGKFWAVGQKRVQLLLRFFFPNSKGTENARDSDPRHAMQPSRKETGEKERGRLWRQ